MTLRFHLFIIWFVGYLVAFILALSYAALQYTAPESIFGYLTQVTGAFAPYFAPIVSYWFASDVVGDKSPPDRLTFSVAYACSLFFNLVIIGILLSVFFREPQEAIIEQTMTLVTKTAALLAFLVGPAIGFFFGKTARVARPPAKPAPKAAPAS